MQISQNKNFNHLKVHTQYSICEGTVKINELKDFCKDNKIQSVGLSDTVNLFGALEFSENISKSGAQPIIGTQIIFKFKDVTGLIPLIALNQKGYKKIIELSSKSYLESDDLPEPYCNFEDLLINPEGIAVFSGSINGLIGKLFIKRRLNEINEIYKKISSVFKNNFYIEIQRHGDLNEKSFENLNLQLSNELKIPIIATHEVFYINKSMHDAHDALICIGSKTYVNERNRIKLTSEHYFKTNEEMTNLFSDLPEALENNYNFPYRCNYRPLPSKPILPRPTHSLNIHGFLKAPRPIITASTPEFFNIFLA